MILEISKKCITEEYIKNAPNWAIPTKKGKNSDFVTIALPKDVYLYDANDEYLFIQNGSEIGYAVAGNRFIEEIGFYPV